MALEPAVAQAVSDVVRGTMIRPEYLFPRNLPEVDLDLEAFSHAIRNIVTNSVQAMDKGRRALLRGERPAHTVLLPARPAAQGRRLRLPAHPGPGPRASRRRRCRASSSPTSPRAAARRGLGLNTALSSIQRMGGTMPGRLDAGRRAPPCRSTCPRPRAIRHPPPRMPPPAACPLRHFAPRRPAFPPGRSRPRTNAASCSWTTSR
ncbi:MAG: hypothetical protein WDO13_17165 [Verrucomicrobiota bacterium]